MLYCFVLLTVLVTFIAVNEQTSAENLATYGPPKVETNPMYLDSFVPAAMQVITHATELMKYEPPATQYPPPTTQEPVTSSHNPGIYAPAKPPTLLLTKQPTSFIKDRGEVRINYLRRPATSSPENGDQNPSELYKNWNLFGKLHTELYEKVNNRINEDFDDIDEKERVENFLEEYDDDFTKSLRKKKPPPVKAYLTLLNLYDSINKEAKKLGLSKYAGYTRAVLEELESSSKGTSSSQMRTIFARVVARNDIRVENILKTMKTLINDLEQPNSYLNNALKHIPPLAYDSKFNL